MNNPVFWLGLSILLVAVSLTAVLIAALPALQAVARAARSLEKLADTLSREFPPTLEAIRMTGLEISELTDDVSEGVQSAGQVVKQVDQSIDGAKKQAQKVQVTTGSFVKGFRVAWQTFKRTSKRLESSRRSPQRLPPSQRQTLSPLEKRSSASYNHDRRSRSGNLDSDVDSFEAESGKESPPAYPTPTPTPTPTPEVETLNSNRLNP